VHETRVLVVTADVERVGSGVAGELVDELKRRIRDGRYRPGDKLPSERALSEEFRVSRPTVREAFRALAALNIVVQRHGSGVYVASLSVADLLEPVRFALQLNEPTLASLFQIRLALEPMAARLAATNANKEEIDGLIRIAETTKRRRLSISAFLDLDADLHERVALAAHDDLLRTIISSLAFLSHESRRHTARKPGVREATIVDHVQIVRSIAARDAIAAERAMQAHLSRVYALSGVEQSVVRADSPSMNTSGS
jgi:DNA-binding FadR family transcriptional regulator